MQINHRQRLVLTWLLLSAVLTVILFVAGHSMLEDAVRERVRRHLLLTLDESNFGNAQNRANDQDALLRIGQQMNAVLQTMVSSRWYAAEKECVVRIRRIDDVDLDDEPQLGTTTISVLRNQKEREVVIDLSCSPDWWVALSVAGFLGLLFVAIARVVPPPLSKTHRQWINYLLERGYSGAQAFAIIRGYDAPRLTLTTNQQACLAHLHDSEQRNFATVLEVVTDPRVAALSGNAVDWFLLGLRSDSGSADAALELARAEDLVVIDLYEMTLSIRGLTVPVSGTPLFYYAWYAMRRGSGDGWITNPASNRPDRASAQELIQLMSRFDGHAKAINDLERTGLKARTLDQNRSKIKDDIVATLGEKLAGTYLFEASKHPDGIHMRYRLHVDASRIQISAGQDK
jgi:hypothetical protein